MCMDVRSIATAATGGVSILARASEKARHLHVQLFAQHPDPKVACVGSMFGLSRVPERRETYETAIGSHFSACRGSARDGLRRC